MGKHFSEWERSEMERLRGEGLLIEQSAKS